MKFCVLDASNPLSKNDYYYNFKDYNTWEDGAWRSWHSFAAIFESEFIPFEQREKALNYDCVLLLGNKDFKALVPFIEKLKVLKKKVAFGLHENFSAYYTMNPMEWEPLKQLVDKCDFYWNLNPPMRQVMEGIFPGKQIVDIPTAYPFEKCKFVVEAERQEGVLIATRTIQQHFHKRNSFFAIASALKATEYKVPITYMNEDGSFVGNHLKSYFNTPMLNVIERTGTFKDWLKLIKQHEAVYQMDMSLSYGQVVCDALLMDVPIIGGNNDNMQYNYEDYFTFQECSFHLDLFFKNDLFKARIIEACDYQKRQLEVNIGFKNTKELILEAFNEV